jgi:hypothetical protein
MMAGRTTVFDNNFYLEASSPAMIPPDAPVAFRASVIIMHIFIQLPRLVCLVRHVINNPSDTDTVAAAVSLAESLWVLDPWDIMEEVLQSSTTVIPLPPAPELADIIPDSLHFNSVDNAILISRYWMLKLSLCGLSENLHLHFPEHATASSIPNLITVQRKDIEAAIDLARCAQYTDYVCPELPILPLRIYTTIQLSIGPWRRLYLRVSRAQDALSSALGVQEDVGLATQLDRAERMEKWIINGCNSMLVDWGLEQVSTKFFQGAAENMAGGPMPDWLPTTVRFEEEEGDMVMKLDYEIPGPRFEMLLGEDDERMAWNRTSTTASPFGKKRRVPGEDSDSR